MEFRQRFFVNLAKKDTLRSSLVVFGRFFKHGVHDLDTYGTNMYEYFC